MPNWTNNTAKIEGSKELIDKMMDSIKDVLDKGVKPTMTDFFPIPQTFLDYDTTNHPNGERLTIGCGYKGKEVTEELIEEFKAATEYQQKEYGVIGWYDYNRIYYGCKWSDCEFNVTRVSDTELLFDEFDTPWSEPDRFFFRLAENFKGIDIETFSHYEDNANTHTHYWYDEDEDSINMEDYDSKEFASKLYDYILNYIDNSEESDEEKDKLREYAKKYIEEDYYNIAYTYDFENYDMYAIDDFNNNVDWFVEDEKYS